MARGLNNETIQLYALTLSSKQPHPSRSPTAQDMICEINTETTDSDADHLSISVSGSLILSYGLYTEYHVGDGFMTEVWVHNWESGELLMVFPFKFRHESCVHIRTELLVRTIWQPSVQ